MTERPSDLGCSGGSRSSVQELRTDPARTGIGRRLVEQRQSPRVPGSKQIGRPHGHLHIVDQLLDLLQIPAGCLKSLEILARADSAGAPHALADH
jgi:hypothetical protein